MTDFSDGVPLKGVRPEHLVDDIIIPSHLNPSVFGVAGNISVIDPDDPAAAGTTGLIADAGHQHPFTTAAASALSKTNVNSEGSSSSMARADHGHSTETLPWGVLASGVFNVNTDDASRAAGVDTDMTVTVALTAGRLYKIAFNSQVALGAAGVTVALELEHDGTIIGRVWRAGPTTNTAGNGPFQVSSTIDYIPTATDVSATLTVSNAAGSGAAVTLQAGVGRRTLTVTDHGPT